MSRLRDLILKARKVHSLDDMYHIKMNEVEEDFRKYITECCEESLKEGSKNAQMKVVDAIHGWKNIDKESITNPKNIVLL